MADWYPGRIKDLKIWYLTHIFELEKLYFSNVWFG